MFRFILILLLASQIFWAVWLARWGKRAIRRALWRRTLGAAALALYGLAFAYTWRSFSRPTPVHLTAGDALLGAPFAWWAAGSIVGFLVAVLLSPLRLAGRLKPLRSPSRRAFLNRSVTTAAAAPFVASAYGVLYGRLNLETTAPRIYLPRLPKALHGFRIAQLSDIHIGPFMPEDEIRRYVEIANSLKPDMIVLTGDFVTFDRRTAPAVVAALSGLRAPLGVYGCLGNHDAWARAEDELTGLFANAGIRILRHAAAPVAVPGGTFNLIGVDFQTRRPFGSSPMVREFLEGVDRLMAPDQVNILLSHNPDTFDRAAGLGIDLSLAGHTHGGQAALEFISPEIAPSRLVTPYVAGHFQKPGGQLYVNRGIGTIGVPIRIGAPPEISVFELVRNA
ncbi:MAG TPA: metallophosphoesterase [Bryobacteraceae bacterium]|jgi:predicted MPP superfamily phosphohydrolase|nr:metallophosphoesterase [Bryobacteraceae bacterium]